MCVCAVAVAADGDGDGDVLRYLISQILFRSNAISKSFKRSIFAANPKHLI